MRQDSLKNGSTGSVRLRYLEFFYYTLFLFIFIFSPEDRAEPSQALRWGLVSGPDPDPELMRSSVCSFVLYVTWNFFAEGRWVF